jgi:hypothetical protein
MFRPPLVVWAQACAEAGAVRAMTAKQSAAIEPMTAALRLKFRVF